MLALIHETTILSTVLPGDWVSLPNGSRLSPAQDGWSDGEYRLSAIEFPGQVPEGKRVTGTTLELVGGVPTYVHALEDIPVLPPAFLPIEPADFWYAVYDLFGIKDTDVLDAVTDPEERYLAANSMARRKTYLRTNTTFIQLAALKGYTDPSQVDDLWLYIQAHYSS